MTAGWNVGKNGSTGLVRVAWSAVLSAILISGTCWLNAAEDAPQVGLRGVLPAAVPADLSGAIASLPDNWKDWGAAVTTELSNLYETEGLDVPAQRKAIAALRKRESAARAHAADPKYRSILNLLVTLSGGLKRRLDVAQASLDTLEAGAGTRTAKIESARQKVLQQAQTVDSYLASFSNGAGWKKFLQLNEIRTDAIAEAAVKAQSRLKDKASLPDVRARDFLARPQFKGFEEALDAYLAATATPELTANSPELRQKLAELLAALEDYESGATLASTGAVRKAFDGVRALAPDGAEKLALALRDNYLNYNLRVVASEAFLNKFFHQSRDEVGPVTDFVLGANVSGNQNTHTEVDIDLVPSNSSAQFDLKASGRIASNTVGVTSQASVYTYGNHAFTAAKRIVFDGEKFGTQAARIGIRANNTTTGADTNMGLFKGIADNIAVSRAEEMRGESEAIAAQRIREQVLPRFNAEVDKEFSKFNPDIAARLTSLRELNLFPEAKSWSTTDKELKVATRLMGNTDIGGSEPSPAMYLGRGVTVLMHDSLLNNSLDRLGVAGKTMTEAETKAHVEAQATKLLGKEVKFEDGKAEAKDDSGIKSIVFDQTDPIRVHSDDGVLSVTLRAGFQQEGKEDIPTQIITIPLQFTVTNAAIILEAGNIEVSAAEKPESAAKQLAQAGVIKKKLASAFPKRELQRIRRIKEKNINTVIAVTRIRALDGWLSISVE
ncbi:MAG: hypothetical protein JSS02_29125 [Planctomycetes bacterium]|nr:hypothetical protein [Planctomycetota bacterium]